MALNIYVKMLDNEMTNRLKKYFQNLDKDGTGMVSKAEMKEYLTKSKLKISEEDLNQIFAQVDSNKDN